MSAQNATPETARPSRRGPARPVEPGARMVTLTWEDLDGIFNAMRQASDELWLIHMGAESSELTSEATGAIQQVAQDGISHLGGAMETIGKHIYRSQVSA